MIDKRLLKVEFDHAQSRVKRPRIGFTLRGLEFIDGILEGTWVNPVSGKLQPIPNSEEADFTTSNTGRFAKWQLSEGTTRDDNTPAGAFQMAGAMGMHADSAIKFVGTNASGVGFKTDADQPENEGVTLLVFNYGAGTDSDAILADVGFSNSFDYLEGVSVRIHLSGKVLIYRAGLKVGQGSVSGGGYSPGTVRGASYERASNEYVMVRIEAVQGKFLQITTSKGGTFQFACPWTADGTAVLPEAQRWWFIPKGGAMVVAAPVLYGYSTPYAVSPPYRFQEIPTAVGGDSDILTARVIPDGAATVALVKEDGVTPYDRLTDTFRVKVTFTGAHFVSGVAGGYPRLAVPTPEAEGGPIDVSDWLISCPASLGDGLDGFSIDLSVRGDAPVPLLSEVELRPIRFTLIPHPDDTDPPDPLVLLDGVGGAPDWEDGYAPDQTEVRIKVTDRMTLVKEAQLSETVVFDGLPLCRPVGDGESVVSMCLREGGITNAELEFLPEILNAAGELFLIEDTPGQRAGEWNFAGEVGDLWSDILERAMGFAPEVIWGLKPTPDGTRVYAIDPSDADPIEGIFYRTPEAAALDPEYEENELGAWPLLYGEPHRRVKLPREANVVRVTGYDAGADKGLQSFISDDDSRDPEATLSAGKLAATRQFAYSDPALSTQAMVDDLTERIWKAITLRVYIHSWPAFLRFKADGSPIWRGERVTLKASTPEGTDETIRISGFSFEPIDESGGGVMDEDGAFPPVSIRLAEYTGGATVGLGGSTLDDILRRQRDEIAYGGLRRTGFGRIPSTSMAEVVRLAMP